MRNFWQVVSDINESGIGNTLSTKTIIFLYLWLVEEDGRRISEGLDRFSRSIKVSIDVGKIATDELIALGIVVKEDRQFSSPKTYRLVNSILGNDLGKEYQTVPSEIARWLVSNKAPTPKSLREPEKMKELGRTKLVLLSALLSLSNDHGYVLGFSLSRLSSITGIPKRSIKIYLKEFRQARLIVSFSGLPKAAGFGQTSSVIIIRLESMLRGDLVTLYRSNRRTNDLRRYFNRIKIYNQPSFFITPSLQAVWELSLKVWFESPETVNPRSHRHMQYFDELRLYIASKLVCMKKPADSQDAMKCLNEVVRMLPRLPALSDQDNWTSPNNELFVKVKTELDLPDVLDEDLPSYSLGALIVFAALDLASLVRKFSENDSRFTESILLESETKPDKMVRFFEFKDGLVISSCKLNV